MRTTTSTSFIATNRCPSWSLTGKGNSSGHGARACLRRRTSCASIVPVLSGLPIAVRWWRTNLIPSGKLLLTLGRKGVTGDNSSHDAFNGLADVAVAKNGDIFVADGEGPNTRVAKFSKAGSFIKWWGGKGAEPGQFDTPHSIAIDSKNRVYVADRANNRVQIFDQDGRFLNQWTNFGTPWGLFIKGDLIYVVDGTANNCLLIARIKDGKVLEKIEGLSNPTAVAVDSAGVIYVAEVNGTNVKKFVRK